MLQIVKGQVEYLGRNDYQVSYTTVGETQYFITKELANGKYIVAKQLIDAILKDAISNGAFKEENGQAKEIPVPTSFGVIDENGTEIIPCQYKSVKDIGTDYYAVEPTELINDSVKERANLFKEDPNNQIFVTTNSSVTEKMYAKMGGSVTEFVVRDQTSEVTICDAQNNNVVNGEYYSYVAYNDNGIFLSKNVIGSPINEFDFNTKAVVSLDQQQTVEQPAAPQIPVVGEEATPQAEAPAQEALQPEVPVEGVEQQAEAVAPEAVTEEVAPQEEALQPEVPVEGVEQQAEAVAPEAVTEEVAPQEEALQPEVPVEGAEQQTEEVTAEAVTEEVAPQEALQPEVPVEGVEQQAEEVTPEVSSLETTPEEEVTEETAEAPVEETTEEVQPEETVVAEEEPQEEVSEEAPEAVEEVEEELTDEVEDKIDVSDVEIDKDEIEDEINDESDTLNIEDSDDKEDTFEADDEFKVNLDDYDVDTKYDYGIDENIDSSYDYDDEETRAKSILPNAAIAMNNLIKEHKSQKNHIEKLENSNENLKTRIVSMDERSKKLESHIRTIEKENEKLKEKLHDQSIIIDKQDRKIIAINKERVDSIERQRKSEEELAKLVQVAYGELSSDSRSYGYEDYGSKRMVA